MHLASDHYYADAISGNAVGIIGDADAVMLVATLFGTLLDDCPGCISDSADAVAVNIDAAAVLQRLYALSRGAPCMLPDHPDAAAICDRLARTSFEQRKTMVLVAANELMDNLKRSKKEQQ